MNTKLITALRTAAKAIEMETFPYKWEAQERCNCGVVVCSLLGMSPDKLRSKIPHSDALKGPTWTQMAGFYCPITGIPDNELFKELYSLGLTSIEIKNLEDLSDPEILLRMKCKKENIRYDNKQDLIRYLRAWADILVERGSQDGSAQETVQEDPEPEKPTFLQRMEQLLHW